MKKYFEPSDFGAVNDGSTFCTEAFQKALDAASEVGGTVLIASGCTYLIGTVYIKSHTTVYLEHNAKILGSNILEKYTKDTGINPYYPEMIDRCLIYCKDCEDVSIEGPGTIDGGCDGVNYVYPADAVGREARQRPMLLRLEDCKNIRLTALTLTRAGAWCVHLKHLDNVRLTDVTIINKRQDGFNIEGCSNVTISGCKLECGDDAIALTTSRRDKPIKNLTVTNCIMTTRWSAVRMGPLSKGNFENVTVSNCVFTGCGGGGFKLGMYEGAEIRNCTFSNIVMDGCAAPVNLLVDRFYDIGNLEEKDDLMPLGSVHHLMFSNIRVIAKKYPLDAPNNEKWAMPQFRSHSDLNDTIFIHGYPGSDIHHIFFENIHVTFEGGGSKEIADRRDVTDMDGFGPRDFGYWTDGKSVWGPLPAYAIYARHAKSLRFNQVYFDLAEPDARVPVYMKECSDVEFSLFETEHGANRPEIIADKCGSIKAENTIQTE